MDWDHRASSDYSGWDFAFSCRRYQWIRRTLLMLDRQNVVTFMMNFVVQWGEELSCSPAKWNTTRASPTGLSTVSSAHKVLKNGLVLDEYSTSWHKQGTSRWPQWSHCYPSLPLRRHDIIIRKSYGLANSFKKMCRYYFEPKNIVPQMEKLFYVTVRIILVKVLINFYNGSL